MLAAESPHFLLELDGSNRDALAALFLSLHESAYQAALVLFGASCLANAVAMLDSHSPVPKPLGALFALAGGCYIVDSLGLLIVPAYTGAASAYLMIPVVIAEISFCAWLLWYGKLAPVRSQRAQVVSAGELRLPVEAAPQPHA
jgi:hypothetical protein